MTSLDGWNVVRFLWLIEIGPRPAPHGRPPREEEPSVTRHLRLYVDIHPSLSDPRVGVRLSAEEIEGSAADRLEHLSFE